MVLVLFANTNFKMYLLKVLSLIQELRFNVSVSVSMSGSGAVGLGVGVGSYQPGVYVPLKALFLVLSGMVYFGWDLFALKMFKQFYLSLTAIEAKPGGHSRECGVDDGAITHQATVDAGGRV